jgi:hypothetical protein
LGGAASRANARQFVIGQSIAIRWGETVAGATGKGQSRSPTKKHGNGCVQEPDLSLEEIQRSLLDERQQKAGIGFACRFLR